MAQVYQNANLVITTAGVSEPREGCFSDILWFSMEAEAPFYRKDGPVDGCFKISLKNPEASDVSRASGPLQQRGWNLQESYLARRTFYFMT
jgi:hypothetical protein